MPEYHPGTEVMIMDGVPGSEFRNAIPNVKRYLKSNGWEITDVAQAAFEGDFDKLEMLLATGDENNLFNGDLNQHLTSTTALQLSAQAGNAECVELLLRVKADPHIRENMPYGQDPEDGRTALDFAREAGWEDCAELLEASEKATPYGWYVPAGATNNAKCYGCWEWGKKPEKGWYFARPGAARKQGLDPKRYGAEDYEEPDILAAAAAPPPVAPGQKPLPIGLLFPGQGSQYVKMMTGVKDIPAVQDMLQKAKTVLGYDVLSVCLNGPEEELEQTSKCQAAMFVAGMAGLEKLRQDREEAVTRCQVLAGLSSGEYTALCAAGVFTFEEGLKIIKARGEAMQEAANACKQSMLSLAGLEKAKVEELCAEVERELGGSSVCKVSSYLFPKGFACAGTEDAVLKLKEKAEKAGALQAKVAKVSGAWHTPLMKSAQDKLGQVLEAALPKMKPPRCSVYMNATAAPIRAGTPPKEIVAHLQKSMVSLAQWDPSVRAMIRDGVSEFYEVGPMKQIKAMMKRTDQKIWGTTYNVEV